MFKQASLFCSCIRVLVFPNGVADISELIYGGHCDDSQDGHIVAALTEALMLTPKELSKVSPLCSEIKHFVMYCKSVTRNVKSANVLNVLL